MHPAGYFYSLRASKGSDVAAVHGLTVPFFSLLDSLRR
jgi:hypothetical protein